jgi:hypothetical protein
MNGEPTSRLQWEIDECVAYMLMYSVRLREWILSLIEH